MIQARLKLEIIAGYLIWVSFFVLIVCIIHDSRQKRSTMERQEAHWQGERQQTNRAFLSLLDLASTGELIAGWTEEDYAAYQKKRRTTVTLLQKLKAGQGDSMQRACIDSVCNLLIEKETQMATLLQLLGNMPDAGEIVHRKIPAVVSQDKKENTHREETPATKTGEKKKRFLEPLPQTGKEIGLCPAKGSSPENIRSHHRFRCGNIRCRCETFGTAALH